MGYSENGIRMWSHYAFAQRFAQRKKYADLLHTGSPHTRQPEKCRQGAGGKKAPMYRSLERYFCDRRSTGTTPNAVYVHVVSTRPTRLSRRESLSEKYKTAHDDGLSIRIAGRSAI